MGETAQATTAELGHAGVKLVNNWSRSSDVETDVGWAGLVLTPGTQHGCSHVVIVTAVSASMNAYQVSVHDGLTLARSLLLGLNLSSLRVIHRSCEVNHPRS